MAGSVQIVDGLSGELVCEVQVASLGWKVRDVKLEIQKAVGLHPREQRLIYGGCAVRKNQVELGKSPLGDLLLPGASGFVRLVRIDPAWEIHLNFIADAALVLGMGPSWHDGDPAAMEQAHAFLQSRDFVLAAVQESGGVLHHAAEDLKHDRSIVLAAVRENGAALAFAAEELRSDRDVVFEALKENGMALEFAAESLRADRDVVLAAVSQCGDALRFAMGEIQWDMELALEAVRNSAAALRYVVPYIQHDPDFVRAAVTLNGDVLHYVDEELRNDEKIVQSAETFWKKDFGQANESTSPRRAHQFLKALEEKQTTVASTG